MYRIEVDTPRRLVEVTLSGMLSVEEVGRYMSDLRAQIDAAGIATDYVITVDVSTGILQPVVSVLSPAIGQLLLTYPSRRTQTRPEANRYLHAAVLSGIVIQVSAATLPFTSMSVARRGLAPRARRTIAARRSS